MQYCGLLNWDPMSIAGQGEPEMCLCVPGQPPRSECSLSECKEVPYSSISGGPYSYIRRGTITIYVGLL